MHALAACARSSALRLSRSAASLHPPRPTRRRRVRGRKLVPRPTDIFLLTIVAIVVFWTVQVSALLAFAVPFTWVMLGLWAVSHFVRALGLTLCFHRYFAHRAFQMSRASRFVWAFIGTAAMQKGPLWWAGHHVNHHKYADRDGDPHSPAVSGVYYAHIGWFLNDTKNDQLEPSNPVMRDFGPVPELALLERYFFVPPAILAVAMYLAGGWPWL